MGDNTQVKNFSFGAVGVAYSYIAKPLVLDKSYDRSIYPIFTQSPAYFFELKKNVDGSIYLESAITWGQIKPLYGNNGFLLQYSGKYALPVDWLYASLYLEDGTELGRINFNSNYDFNQYVILDNIDLLTDTSHADDLKIQIRPYSGLPNKSDWAEALFYKYNIRVSNPSILFVKSEAYLRPFEFPILLTGDGATSLLSRIDIDLSNYLVSAGFYPVLAQTVINNWNSSRTLIFGSYLEKIGGL